MSKKMPIWKEGAIVTAQSMFNDFYTHPEYKGKNFTWERAPEIISRQVEVIVFTWYPRKISANIKQKAKEAAREEVQRLAKENGLT